MKYLELVDVYQELDSTTKRLNKTYFISEFLKKVNIDELEIITLLLQGRLYPRWDDRKIGVASKLVLKAMNIATGIDLTDIEKKWKQEGDLGLVAEKIVAKKKQATLFSQDLTIDKVYKNLSSLSQLEGMGTVDKKVKLIAELLTSAKPIEAKYIVRTVLEEMRVGIGEGTLRDAIVWAYFPKIENIHSKCSECKKIVPKGLMKECLVCGHKFEKVESSDVTTDEHFETSLKFIESLGQGKLKVDEVYRINENERDGYNYLVNAVQEALDVTNDFSKIAKVAKEKGLKGLEHIELKVDKPIKVMLYQKAHDFEDAFERVGKPAAFEYKYDGFRLQIHKIKDKIMLYTRRLENVTNQFPDVVELVEANLNAKEFIIDAEITGIDPITKKYLAFQNISQRIKRKYEIEKMVKEIPIIVNLFDAMSVNGQNLLKLEFLERRKLLKKITNEVKDKIVLAKQIITSDIDEAKKFYETALNVGNEGVMAKKLDAPYKPGSRVGYGVKIKPTMETLDLVIVGAEWGEGKRSSWLSTFVIACKDEDTGEFVEIGKVGTGIKEKIEEGVSFEELTNLLKPLIISEKGKEIKVKPKIVIEVDYEEIQKSVNYNSGYALRFPRLVKLREDKPVDEVSSLEMVEEFYFAQRGRG